MWVKTDDGELVNLAQVEAIFFEKSDKYFIIEVAYPRLDEHGENDTRFIGRAKSIAQAEKTIALIFNAIRNGKTTFDMNGDETND